MSVVGCRYLIQKIMSDKTISLKPRVKPDRIIGIDPDAVKSGFARLDVKERIVRYRTLEFPSLIEHLKREYRRADLMQQNIIVIIEGGWLNSGNWHLPTVCSKYKAAAQGRSVGMNHQTGILIAEMCKYLGIPFEVVKPLQKIWKGKDRKITHEELEAITGIAGRTNQEERDAALLAWWYAGLPIKINNR